MIFLIFQRISLLEQTYSNIEDVDLYVGMIMESPCSNDALVQF
jgi:hypothetical protein